MNYESPGKLLLMMMKAFFRRKLAVGALIVLVSMFLFVFIGPYFFPMNLNAIKIGDVAFMGIPGEPFNAVGRGIKEAKGWDLVM